MLTLALVAGTCALLAVNGFLRVGLGAGLLRRGALARPRDDRPLARAAATGAREPDGERAAVDAIDA